jgi:hypothetical protein
MDKKQIVDRRKSFSNRSPRSATSTERSLVTHRSSSPHNSRISPRPSGPVEIIANDLYVRPNGEAISNGKWLRHIEAISNVNIDIPLWGSIRDSADDIGHGKSLASVTSLWNDNSVGMCQRQTNDNPKGYFRSHGSVIANENTSFNCCIAIYVPTATIDNIKAFDVADILMRTQKSFGCTPKLQSCCFHQDTLRTGSLPGYFIMALSFNRYLYVNDAQLHHVFEVNGWELDLKLSVERLYYNIVYHNTSLLQVLSQIISSNMLTYRCFIEKTNIRLNICSTVPVMELKLECDSSLPITPKQYFDNYKLYLNGRVLITNETYSQVPMMSYTCPLKDIELYYNCFDSNCIMALAPVNELDKDTQIIVWNKLVCMKVY